MTKENKSSLAIFEGKKKRKGCRHDHKNAIQVGNIDYMCPLCKEIIDPMEWFLMNSFDFIDVDAKEVDKK